ncbi:MAG: alpha/beta hydrolase [Myxococcota bacterium]
MTASDAPQFYHVRGMKLAYWTFGDPAGRPLLCLHGFLDHGASFRFMAEHLPDFFVVAPDMRGHGHSDWVGAGGYYHFYDYYDDCRALVAELGWKHFDLLGHSMGGSISTALAALSPEHVTSLVLLEGMGPPFSDLTQSVSRLERWSNQLRKPMFEASPADRRNRRKVIASVDDAARRLQAVNPRLSAERALAFAQRLTEPMDSGVAWRYDPLNRTPSAKPFIKEEAEAIWRGIRAPVLSVFGADTAWKPADLDARHACLARVITHSIPDAGHNLHHDRPDTVAQLVHSWSDKPGHPI